MPELLLYGGNIAGLSDNMLSHGMPRTMWCPSPDLRDATDSIPDGIDHPDRQASRALRHRGGRQEQRRRRPPRGVLHALLYKIVRDGLGALPTSLPPTILRIPLNIKRLAHFTRYDVVMSIDNFC